MSNTSYLKTSSNQNGNKYIDISVMETTNYKDFVLQIISKDLFISLKYL